MPVKGKGGNMKTFKITFNDGDTVVTKMAKGVDLQKATDYYLNNWFNFGIEGDLMKQAVKVEEL